MRSSQQGWLRRGTALIAWLAVMPIAHAQDAAAQVDAHLAKLKTMSATFTQVVRDKDGEIIERATGSFSMSRPDRFRWDYRQPHEQTIVADGKRVWLYDRDLDQVTVRPLAAGLGATPAMLLSGQQKVADAFDSAGIDKDGRWAWLRLRPRSPSSDFSDVGLAFDSRGALASMELKDKLGQLTLIDFADVRLNVRLDDKLFQYSPPAGADVIGDAGT